MHLITSTFNNNRHDSIIYWIDLGVKMSSKVCRTALCLILVAWLVGVSMGDERKPFFSGRCRCQTGEPCGVECICPLEHPLPGAQCRLQAGGHFICHDRTGCHHLDWIRSSHSESRDNDPLFGDKRLYNLERDLLERFVKRMEQMNESCTI